MMIDHSRLLWINIHFVIFYINPWTYLFLSDVQRNQFISAVLAHLWLKFTSSKRGVACDVNVDWRGADDQEASSDITFQNSSPVATKSQSAGDRHTKTSQLVWTCYAHFEKQETKGEPVSIKPFYRILSSGSGYVQVSFTQQANVTANVTVSSLVSCCLCRNKDGLLRAQTVLSASIILSVCSFFQVATNKCWVIAVRDRAV